jgi:hypothetical protein
VKAGGREVRKKGSGSAAELIDRDLLRAEAGDGLLGKGQGWLPITTRMRVSEETATDVDLAASSPMNQFIGALEEALDAEFGRAVPKSFRRFG